MNTTLTQVASHLLDREGELVEDARMNRQTKELIGASLTITETRMKEIWDTIPYNNKFDPELRDFDEWYHRWKNVNRRQQIYFNNKDFALRMQCISLIQIIDNQMIVYQRSGDVEKMQDDHRFFVHLVKNYFQYVNLIHVIYGSLHKTV